MKKVICIVLVLLASLVVVANAETDISQMSLEELYQLRSEINDRIVALCSSMKEIQSEGDLGTIAELFPDEAFAKAIRNELNKLSISQPVTQEELNSITKMYIGSSNAFGNINSIEGIGYLTNLESLYIVNYAAENMTSLPDELFSLTNLNCIFISGSSIKEVPSLIGNLINLKTLSLGGSDITTLPNDLANCKYLEKIDISHTDITELPEVLYSLNLKEIDMAGLPIK